MAGPVERTKAVFEDRHQFKMSEILKTSHKQLMLSLKETSDKYAYQGFDPLKIANTMVTLAENGGRNLDEDLFRLIVLFFCRGANAQRLKDPTTSRISDDETHHCDNPAHPIWCAVKARKELNH